MKRIIAFLLLAFVAMACERDGPTVPVDAPQFAKDKDCTDPRWQDHPSCTGGSGGETTTAQLVLCAKKTVVDDINDIEEEDTPGWEDGPITSTTPECECGPEFCPQGMLTYTTAGPEFEWKFSGSGFVPISYEYQLIVYPDPWPGRDLICLGSFRSMNHGGKVRIASSMDLGVDLAEAKIWIVRSGWLDCNGTGFYYRGNPDGVARLTNDWNGDGTADATQSCLSDTDPLCNVLMYDWLFETVLIDYDDTDVN